MVVLSLISLISLPLTAAEAFTAREAAAFIETHCAKCHRGDKPKGGFAVAVLEPATLTGKNASAWLKSAEQLKHGEMPPDSRPQPEPAATRRMLAWFSAELQRVGVDTHALDAPLAGNHLDHAALFSGPATAPLDHPPRLWRLSPQLYLSSVKNYNNGRNPLTQPMSAEAVDGFFDLAEGRTIDAGTLSTLMRNATRIAGGLTAHTLENGQVVMAKGGVGVFAKLLDPAHEPDRETFDGALRFLLGYRRTQLPDGEQFARLFELYRRTRSETTAAVAARAVVTALFLQPEEVFRLELGLGPVDAQGRRRLSGVEIAAALGAALRDQPLDRQQVERARKGAFDSREGVAAEVRALLSGPPWHTPRLLRFFQEYFAYTSAPTVFKDKALNPDFYADALVSDTDQLIQVILLEDRDVLKELLTTRRSFIGSRWNLEKNTGGPLYPKTNNFRTYNLSAWPDGQQPVTLPDEQRLGVLTQPSWLVARSQNFNNDVIRRGKWIRERLLGQTIPEVPITVCAVLPDDASRTLRDRVAVTAAEECWGCHQRMNPLGLPFEQFDHFGRYRVSEVVEDPGKPPIPGKDPRRDPPRPALRDAPLDTSGALTLTGDPHLDGPVKNAHELITRLAASTRVRQVFVRHVFRYFMGRAENLGDATTLREADRAYVDSGGSFKALLVSLLSSDSFLYRSAPEQP